MQRTVLSFVTLAFLIVCLTSVSFADSLNAEGDSNSGALQCSEKHPPIRLTPGCKAGDRRVIKVNGMEFAFRWCPAGTFTIGMPYTDYAFQHSVTLSKGFWISETEVTQKQWEAVMGNNPSLFKGDDRPVTNISWNDCKEFCHKTGMQLPTEAQWEYACRSGTTGEYAGKIKEMAWFYDNAEGETHPVGTKKPNAWGIYDMHGNALEWCEDKNCVYPKESVTDPIGESYGKDRIARGGGIYSYFGQCMSGYRLGVDPEHKGYSTGFRCVINL